jgi:hypothetical protein
VGSGEEEAVLGIGPLELLVIIALCVAILSVFTTLVEI